MMEDDRFLSSMESEDEEKWLPMQVLLCLQNVTTLNEETQIEALRVSALPLWLCLTTTVYSTSVYSLRYTFYPSEYTQYYTRVVHVLYTVEDEA